MRPHLASLVDEFHRHAAETAVVAHRGNRSYRTTYGELAQLAGRFSAELELREVKPGDRVVLWGENSAEWIGVFFGCLLRGAIAVPLDAAGSREFAGRVVNEVSPKLIVGDRALLGMLSTEVAKISFAGLGALLPEQPLFAVSDAVGERTPFQIIFTSGTTSDPKGIVHTHRNVLVSLQPIEDEIARYRRYERWVHPLRFLHTLPLSHVFGQFMGLWISALLGAELHFSTHLEPARMTELIRNERISVLIAVPRIIELLHAHLLARFDLLDRRLKQSENLSVVKRWWRFRRIHRALGWKFWAIISGGATLPHELEAFWHTLGFALIQGYGMTETAALVTLNHPFRIGRGTIGKALPGREVSISDDGEILVRGDILSQSTWQNGAMRARAGEWLATGDLAEREESGELRFLGRKGDVIVTSAGMNIHPDDLEAAMKQQQGVRECVVVPCNLQGNTEPVAAVIFSGSDEEMSKAVDQANRVLASFQQIRRVLRWPELSFPYTSTGKLLRREVAKRACTALEVQRSVSGIAHDDALLKVIAEVTGESVMQGDDGQRLSEDLHLDSLGRVQLQSILEQRLGVELDDASVASAATLGDLRSMIAQGDFSHGIAVAGTPSSRINAEVARGEDVHFYAKWPWTWPVRVARVAFIELIMRPLIWLLAAPRVEREAALPDGPVLVIANHVTAYDGALVLYALPGKLRRRTAIAMAAELLEDMRMGRGQGKALLNFFAPAGYWLLTALFNIFPLPRSAGFRRSFAHAGRAMDRGYSVFIFPEGARSNDGRLRPFRAGTGLLAHESRVPVVPVELIGLGDMLQTRHWFRSGKLKIHVGAAIPVDENADPARLTAKFEQHFERLR